MSSLAIHSDTINRLEKEGLVSRTFRRLDPERMDAVLRAVCDEAYSAGGAELNIKRVAERAGIAVGSLYQYFGSREGMVKACASLVAESLAAELDSYRSQLAALPLRQGLRVYLEAGIEWSRTESGFLRFFGSSAYSSSTEGDAEELKRRLVRPVALSLQAMVRTLVEAAAARGELRSGLDVEAAARMANAVLIILGDAILIPTLNEYFLLYDADRGPDELLGPYLDILESGIAAEAREAECA
jgi:TetR/AcrR family transcriptional regulator